MITVTITITGIGITMKACDYRLGRVWLHLVCMLRDHHWLWHWRGIQREWPPRH